MSCRKRCTNIKPARARPRRAHPGARPGTRARSASRLPLDLLDAVVDRLHVGLRAGLVQRFAPRHLLHQEGRRHGGVVLGLDRGAGQFAQVGPRRSGSFRRW
jgi:hypothetical protein